MYGVVNGLQGGAHLPKPRFRFKKQEEAPKEPSKPCCQAILDGLRTLFLRLRAAILILVLSSGIPGFYLTHHFLLKPGLAALGARLQPAACEVSVSIVLKGIKNCTWSSCRQGCTAEEMYTCWQVLITPHRDGFNFTERTQNLSLSTEDEDIDYPIPQALMALPIDDPDYYEDTLIDIPASITPNTTITRDFEAKNVTSEKVVENASTLNISTNLTGLVKLKINAAGCGYSSCQDWWKEYGKLGTIFPCYIGADDQIAVPDFDASQTTKEVAFGTLPLVLTGLAFALMYRLYWRKGHTDNTLSLSPSREVKNVKIQQARAQILMQMARENQMGPRKKRLSDVWKFAMMSKRMAKVKPYESSDNMENAHSSENNGEARVWSVKVHNGAQRISPADQWRKVAMWAATRHPCISSARKFTEVEFDIIDES